MIRKPEDRVLQPGDVTPEGWIIVGKHHAASSGIFFVSVRQARKAEAFGWELLDGTPTEEGLVRISRAGRHPHPFSKTNRGYRRRREREIIRRAKQEGTM